ncbi:hypothetical protein [Archangium lansingense]|uniref:Lipoprotein n=1 Tax=Archangium lansingense TaxID=2995310 RepID=A0ABT4AI31_9BACT|nr:hypothetical protein [Archangium lansinium]MCY1080542.1 hypothetical protein [Archangium lansinium]
MRLRSLAVVLLVSGCQQPTPPEPANVPERPPSTEQALGAQPASPNAPGEAQPSDAQPSETQPFDAQPSEAQASPADEIPEQTWTARSADGNAEVQQTALRNGKSTRCTSTSTWSSPRDERKVMWKWDTCIATREQLKFVSPDGKRVLVIDPSPASLRTKGDWRDAEVATLYEHGVRVKGAKAGALLDSPIEVREPALRIIWVTGHGGFPGAPPRYTSDGKAVEFETVDGHTPRLGFDGEGFPVAPEEKQAFTAAADMYQYEDEKKTVHFVGSLSDVPERYRSRARPVEAQVLTVSGSLNLGAQPPPEPEPSLDTAKGPSSKEPLENPQIASPAELLNKARDTVKKVEEVQRLREQLAESQLSESSPRPGGTPSSSGPSSPPSADKNPSPTGPLEKAKIPTPAELLERAREVVKKAEESQSTREKVMDGKPVDTQH